MYDVALLRGSASSEELVMDKPILQVAIDLLDLKRALKVAKEAARGGADWIEVGTPLLKSEGLKAVRAFKKAFKGKRVVADMKTVDTGRLEVEAAAKAGADVVVLLGLAANSTIREAVKAAKNYGCEIMVDLMNVQDQVKRAKDVGELGVDYVCVHLGIDEQMLGKVSLANLVDGVRKAVSIPVAVAGGITVEDVPELLEAGASILVVGGAITKAKDAEAATREFKLCMEKRKKGEASVGKKYLNPEQVFVEVSVANLSDAMHRRGVMRGIVPIVLTSEKVVGKAVTVRVYPGDWAKPVEAIDIASDGDVIVIDAGGVNPAIWGELASLSCKLKGVRGVVIDGMVRDVAEIEKIGFPVFAKGIDASAGEPKGLGEINVPIRCGGVLVRPGDYVIADRDGVLVVPREEAVEIANRALDIYEREGRLKSEIEAGKTLSQLLELKRWERVRK